MGAAIGFTPQQVGDMSPWEFRAAVDGYLAAHSPEDDRAGASADELDAIWQGMKEDGLVN